MRIDEVETLIVVVLQILDEDVSLSKLELAVVDKLEQKAQLTFDGILGFSAVENIQVDEVEAWLEQIIHRFIAFITAFELQNQKTVDSQEQQHLVHIAHVPHYNLSLD